MTDRPDLAAALAAATRAANAASGARLPLADRADFEAATRGRIAPLPPEPIAAPGGRTAWDMAAFDFLDADCPPTVHPSLWRMAQLNRIAGLFEVAEGVWQARGFDYANMTVIQGDTGWILVDPLMTAETSAAALATVNATLGARPVSAILITHCHADHFAGTRGVWREGVPIYAPAEFLRYAASEAVLGGTHMARRAIYQFGLTVPPGPEGVVDGGIGKAVAQGSRGFVAPTVFVGATGETRTVDGVPIVFQMASGTEAPAEFTFLLPEHRVLCMAEVCTQTMHNALPPRGAQVRDLRLWARVIDEAIGLFGDRADVLINSHNWPVWGAEALRAHLAEQRDIYKYTHDQTLRLANLGHSPHEIAAQIAEPDWLAGAFHARGHYGSLQFNARAVYQLYFGVYDGNPVNIAPLPPEALGRRTVAAMGGPEAAMAVAEAAVAEDDLQWAATVLGHLVFAGHEGARPLLALVHRHQGFRMEASILRNCYLTAAQELEQGIAPRPMVGGRNADLSASLGLTDWFDALALRLNPDRARGVRLALTLVVDGTEVAVTVERQVEFARIGARAEAPDATLTLSMATLDGLAAGTADLAAVTVEGDRDAVARWLALHDSFQLWFPIVTP